MRVILIALTLALLVTAVTPFMVFGQHVRWYAHSDDSVSNLTGLKATIETADPEVDSGHSLETIWLHGPGSNSWLEVGWLKGSGSPRMYTYCSPASTCQPYIASGFTWHEWPSVGSSHSYKIEHGTGNQWKLYIDGELKRTVTDAGFSAGVEADIGGEVTSDENEMGTSGLLNVKYEINDDGVWRNFDGTEKANEGYWIVELWGTTNNMQNGICANAPQHC